MRVIVVDDHEVVREGLVAILGAADRIEVVGAAGTGRAAMAVALRTGPDAAIVDLRLPDMLGSELCRHLLRAMPGLHVVILSTYLSEASVRAAREAGAASYVTKAAGLGKLKEALAGLEHRDRHGQMASPDAISRGFNEIHSNAAAVGGPTPRQSRVLDLAAAGLTNREIGERLYLSESTVRFHMQNLKRMLGARTRTELIAKAIRSGAIQPAPEAWPQSARA
jgi:DNA-binding NarL/FixJ family response regulator